MYSNWHELSNFINAIASPEFPHRQPVGENAMVGKNTVLVLGATGGIGGEAARQLRDSGWDVRALQRRAAQSVAQRSGITWIRGDAMNREDVLAAAEGCSVIVHAVNPPGYRRWS